MKIGVIQLQSVLDPAQNLKTIRKFLDEARANGAEAVFLPEVFYSMSDGTRPTPYLVEGKNEHYEAIRKLATDSGLYILGGSAATNVDGKIMNRSYNFSPDGTELMIYDKMNLFAVDLSKHPSNTVVNESKVYTNGNTPKLLPFKEFKIGLSICFDLRFPELFRSYSAQGANVLSISSAFTVPTGKAHWHTLVRARAIENQSYVIASAQWGQHNEKMSTFGHSLIIDPWGEILADAGEGEKIIFAEISLEKIEAVRARMNVLRNPKA
ncbi:carbon-nitrogen hydrolase family protein [Peredibacter starrii]|uniref:Carbon-nitrogen hydrolase family protein n=1 Tax=Peredibacter starrii TaxID=28202 RepID=A0AAX4HNS9_9BACT|nr:carbon-nitrogen hydrolase family protein [Peredibacter starrii]WPU64956.1 carbon-nitrogen hydrolase family protein [Peredibacter starrii]